MTVDDGGRRDISGALWDVRNLSYEGFLMNIGEAARLSGLPPKTIRYYEEVGLVKPSRAINGYRNYGDRDVHLLRFLQRSRSLGFTIEEARRLISLYEDEGRRSEDVKSMASSRMAEIDRKIAELQSLKRALADLSERCHGDDGPDCPILEEISGDRTGR